MIAFLSTACASAAEQREAEALRQEIEAIRARSAKLQQDIEQIERTRAERNRREARPPIAPDPAPHTVEPQRSPSPLAAYEERPPVGYVENRLPLCSGALCLRVVNDRPHPMTDITVNGKPVVLQRGHAETAYLFPHEGAYIALMRTGKYIVTARTVNAVGDTTGELHPMPSITIERCAWSGKIPTSGSIEMGLTDVRLTRSACGQ